MFNTTVMASEIILVEKKNTQETSEGKHLSWFMSNAIQSNLDYQDLWGDKQKVRIIKSLDNRKYE